jgi:NAD(P)-dependent dehydrogenase (short-subunit alcohol dehydrogenase family)
MTTITLGKVSGDGMPQQTDSCVAQSGEGHTQPSRPDGQRGMPGESAPVLASPASDEARHVTGKALFTDGGLLA